MSRSIIALVLLVLCLAVSANCADGQPARPPQASDDPFKTAAVSVPVNVAAAPADEPAEISGEQRIRSALDDKTSFDFVEGTSLLDAISFIKTKHEIEIQFDKPSLGEAVIDPSATQVVLTLKDVTLRSALRLMLSGLGLTHVIEDEVLKIITQAKADATLCMRIYDVHDLIAPTKGVEPPAALNELRSILGGVPSWHKANGSPSLQSFYTGGICAIAVAQTAAVHDEIEKALSDLRKLKKAVKPENAMK